MIVVHAKGATVVINLRNRLISENSTTRSIRDIVEVNRCMGNIPAGVKFLVVFP
jgi:hypothetical protein